MVEHDDPYPTHLGRVPMGAVTDGSDYRVEFVDTYAEKIHDFFRNFMSTHTHVYHVYAIFHNIILSHMACRKKRNTYFQNGPTFFVFGSEFGFLWSLQITKFSNKFSQALLHTY